MLALSTGWLALSAVVATFFAIVLLTFAAAIQPGFWSFVLSGVGSALLSTALALLISEIFLKPLLVRDLLSMTRLRDRFAEISMRDVGPAGRVNWEELYAAARNIDLVIESPTAWMERDLERVLACAARQTYVRVFLPWPAGELSDQVLNAESTLKEAWSRREPKHKRAVLEVWFLKEKPTSFMGRFGDEVVVAVDAGLPTEAKQKMYLHLGINGSSDLQTWIKDRWQWTESKIQGDLAWTSPKSPPDPATVREGLQTKLDDEGSSA